MNSSASDCMTQVPNPNPEVWESVREWRISTRPLLIRARDGIGKAVRNRCLQEIHSSVVEILTDTTPGVIGFYWPIKKEIDLRSLIKDLINSGWSAALPVVVEKNSPLEFCRWEPEMKLVRGVWNIPVPQERHIVIPSVLLIPLVGFDEDNYRLGYGGGYYDRTLASPNTRPLTIGIGLEHCRLKTIYPQRHDIAMDRIVAVRT